MRRLPLRLQTRSFRPLLFALLLMVFAYPAFAQVAINVSFGPPPLPVYEQPLCPAEGYIWTPGYWAWDPDYGYYWVPGTWILAPEVGYLWTPPWWGWDNGGYLFHPGYWGQTVGFYGGINYGFGYFGRGFDGGRWQDNRFYYNRSVVNVNVVNIHNVYNETVVNRGVENRVSYNGGQGGITARPTAREEAVARERHLPPIAAQTQHIDQARGNPELRARTNQGKPPIAATDKPGSFTGHGVVSARSAGGTWHPPANAPENHTTAKPEENRPAPNPSHARDLQPHAVTTRPSGGNTQTDQRYQQQQEKLVQKQNQQHQKLAQQQEKEDQRAQRQNYTQPRQQQMEQQHQQQTQQMEQRHVQQTQQMQERQMGRPEGRPH